MEHSARDLWVVGIGASAGGLQALQQFFSKAPEEGGLAYVVIQHLSPDHKSLMLELLAKYTRLPILMAEDGLQLQPNHIYLNPPTHNVEYQKGRLHLIHREEKIPNLPVDVFFHSLAQELGHQGIGVILSGTGSDGTRGARAIKGVGGLILVQEQGQAQFDGMPRSAISSGAVDMVLPAETMAEQAVHFMHHSMTWGQCQTEQGLPELFQLLEKSTQVDFSGYKKDTLVRRIERRMTLHQVDRLEDYLRLVREHSSELDSLFKEFLIGVTKFFRDPDCFAALSKLVIPTLITPSQQKHGIRCWVPACSTGEEVYTIAILFAEAAERAGISLNLKIFATDLDKESLEVASRAIYPESVMADVEPQRLEKYFHRRADGFEVCRQIRDQVVFARHNLLRDPPFTKLHLVSCRNLLIYFDPAEQRRALSLLHFSLVSGGSLLLGPSEAVGELSDYFHSVDQRHRVFQTLGVLREPQRWKSRPSTDFSAAPTINELGLAVESGYRLLLDEFCPPAFLVNPKGELLHVFVDAERYLRLAPGNVRMELSSLLPPRLAAIVLNGLTRCQIDGEELSFPEIELNSAGTSTTVSLKMRSYRPRNLSAVFVLVIIREVSQRVQTLPVDSPQDSQDLEMLRLRRELDLAREHLQSTVDQLEAANEELQATNEELQATNEELMSSNEELQSVNEELYTLNSEHQAKITELTSLNADIENLLNISEVGTLLLDEHLTIRRFSPAVRRFVNLLERDQGRPVSHLTLNFEFPQFLQELTRTLEQGECLERDFTTLEGVYFRLSMQRYCSAAGLRTQPGVTLTFLDLSDSRKAHSLQATLDALGQSLVVLDKHGKIARVNRAWCEFALANGGEGRPDHWIGLDYFEYIKYIPELAGEIRRVLHGEQTSFQYVYPCHSPEEERWFLMLVNPWGEASRGAVVSHLRLTSHSRISLSTSTQ